MLDKKLFLSNISSSFKCKVERSLLLWSWNNVSYDYKMLSLQYFSLIVSMKPKQMRFLKNQTMHE